MSIAQRACAVKLLRPLAAALPFNWYRLARATNAEVQLLSEVNRRARREMYRESAPAVRVLRVVNCRQKKELLWADRPSWSGVCVLRRKLAAVVSNKGPLCLVTTDGFLLGRFRVLESAADIS